MQVFTTIFLSTFFSALPYLLVAVITSGFIEVFLSRDTVQRLLPRNPIVAIFLVPFFGFFLPLCECGVIPVASRLARKGVPLSVAVVFMLSNPILNPFPYFSTRTAFAFYPQMVTWRMGGAYVIAVAVGLLLLLIGKLDPSFVHIRSYRGGGLWSVLDANPAASPQGLQRRLIQVVTHASMEFFFVGRFFIIGSLAAAAVQTFVPRDVLGALAANETIAVGGMMGFAFLLSVCSEADAFVAATFIRTFPPGALLAFLLFGPMVDIKNLLMMLIAFPRGLVVRLVIIITVLVFWVGLAANLWI